MMTTDPFDNHFGQRLEVAVRARRTPLMVGLDPQPEMFPASVWDGDPTEGRRDLRETIAATRKFCWGVLEVVAAEVPVVKPQVAFFEALGAGGIMILEQLIDRAHELGLLVVLDAKRGDIGSTAEAYARAYLGILPGRSRPLADAITVNPYLGEESLRPFLEVGARHGSGVFVLVKTSNPGGGEFQDLQCGGEALHTHVGRMVERLALASRATTASRFGAAGAVVGATYPRQLAELRQLMPHAWFLIPGFGAQGGTAADVAAGFDELGLGAIVNNSRGILYAHRRATPGGIADDRHWQQAVAAAMRESIAAIREGTPAAKL